MCFANSLHDISEAVRYMKFVCYGVIRLCMPVKGQSGSFEVVLWIRGFLVRNITNFRAMVELLVHTPICISTMGDYWVNRT